MDNTEKFKNFSLIIRRILENKDFNNHELNLYKEFSPNGISTRTSSDDRKQFLLSFRSNEESEDRSLSIYSTGDDIDNLIYLLIKNGFKINPLLAKLSTYDYILKESKIVSRTAKIYDTSCGRNCSFHHNVLVGLSDSITVKDSENNNFILNSEGYVELGDRVSIFSNSIIYKGLIGKTRIGSGTVIGSGSVIGHNCNIGNNCIINSGSIIKPYTWMDDNTTYDNGR